MIRRQIENELYTLRIPRVMEIRRWLSMISDRIQWPSRFLRQEDEIIRHLSSRLKNEIEFRDFFDVITDVNQAIRPINIIYQMIFKSSHTVLQYPKLNIT